ncbi:MULTISPECIES: tRNA (adenosine(37)-N6)-threonylcarbamoyltransferase complex dimerization subunit type 1 TsaB [unclassified Bartonella]|uniref:tRNA (adenosine(37)-N6)-threonylcarbamoyltransferase complex dimerization subunit type 1 TsaB n=1 Tax=unclassified Bartonella TaxID=2645622 RepID=UPI00099949F4|nr:MULTISPECIES: tRNA (adenosine(37)-N6)-threonylcarbamoyltransferase complex dimerization subunit type 1 TsaB [unclassified Bartonella]AQX27466.1 tRNA threonylcarbamoyl adenosine modification protein YeaZ [Bartonella sp. JB15]AQX28746.1 tRNA threonylcarbamoyl adenosine modification protein YeaZ [Bartonella sp. JB63]
MLILAIDTASIYCAVALVQHKSVVARISKCIGKGHAEKLIGQIDQLINQANIKLDQINRIAVNIGPGSFTGIRIGVATARALALALEIPAIGVSSLEALAAQVVNENTTSIITVIIEAGRGMFYHQNFNNNLIALSMPSLKTAENIVADLPQHTILTGPASEIIALYIKNNIINKRIIPDHIPCDAADVLTYAYLAANKQAQAPPRPLYLRDTDAKQQTDFALPRKQ